MTKLKLLSSLLLLSSFLSIQLHAQALVSFRVKDGRLYDGLGAEFIIRGINNPHIWYGEPAYKGLDAIAETHANTVRVVWQTKGTAIELRRIIARVVALKMIAIPEIHDATGSNKIKAVEEAAKYWAREDIKSVLNEFKPYIILNIANEWMNNKGKSVDWFKAYRSCISIIRSSGLTHCLLVDAGGWGQDLEPTKQYADQLIKEDPEHNLLFDVHIYGSWNDNAKIDRELKYFIDHRLALLVGEFGYNYKDGKNNLGCKVDAAHLIQKCQELGIGYMPWSWTGNNKENQWLDMVSIKDWKTPTAWGELMLNSENGIRKTARVCTVFH